MGYDNAEAAVKITEIKVQVRRSSRFSVFVDGKYSFSLSEAGLLEQKLFVGQELDAAEIKKLNQASADDKIYGNVLRFVAMRPRSEWEIHSYLQRKQVSPALVNAILNKLSKSGFVDDLKFAQAWIENRRLLRLSSKRKLQQELRAKRVSDEAIKQVLAEGEVDERQILRDLITKKRAQTRYRDDQKLMQYLARQGFGYDDIKAVMNETE